MELKGRVGNKRARGESISQGRRPGDEKYKSYQQGTPHDKNQFGLELRGAAPRRGHGATNRVPQSALKEGTRPSAHAPTQPLVRRRPSRAASTDELGKTDQPTAESRHTRRAESNALSAAARVSVPRRGATKLLCAQRARRPGGRPRWGEAAHSNGRSKARPRAPDIQQVRHAADLTAIPPQQRFPLNRARRAAVWRDRAAMENAGRCASRSPDSFKARSFEPSLRKDLWDKEMRTLVWTNLGDWKPQTFPLEMWTDSPVRNEHRGFEPVVVKERKCCVRVLGPTDKDRDTATDGS
ncbi:hypothetical protein DFH09DRAFT_1076885 [Mycena vulgaris]|nr:hypothetical protein DFH09DRAFT_1076885 [Mycena vulgaris]